MPNKTEWEPKEFRRYWLLISSLPRGPRYKTVQTLLEELEREGYGATQRTVQRILEYFSREFGLQSRTMTDEAGQPKAWFWDKKTGAPLVGEMDPPTALVYELAGQLLAPLMPKSYLDGMERDFKRARKVLGQVGGKATTLTNKIRVVPRGLGRLPSQINQKVLGELYDSLIHDKQVSISYVAVSGDQTQKSYVVNPLGIVNRMDTMYLVHTVEREESKTKPSEWPIHRIKAATMLESKALTPAGFDLDVYIQDPVFNQNLEPALRKLGPTFTLKAVFPERTARYVEERPFGENQKMKKLPDGRWQVEAKVKNTRELMTQLHDFAADVEVIAPKGLRGYFRELAETLTVQYTS